MSMRSQFVMASIAVALTGVLVAQARAGGCGPTVVEELSGPTFNGAVPGGRATADESGFLCGGSTVLTVEVRDVNLPDGSVLGVSLDFGPVGTITLSGMRGALSADLGHFGVSNDEVRVSYNGNVLLVGAFFR
jgi:hypothetical protein